MDTIDIKTLERYLNHASRILRHRLKNYQVSSRLTLEQLRKLLLSEESPKKELLACTDRLNELIEHIGLTTDSHIEKLISFFKPLNANLSAVIDEALSQIDHKDISIKVERPKKNIFIKASPIITEHIFEIISNSIDSIYTHFPEDKISEGEINIKILRAKNKDNFVVLRVIDNAGGVSPDIINEILKAGFTTKKHTGLGLPLAKSYMESIGGYLQFANYPPNSFLIDLAFQISHENRK